MSDPRQQQTFESHESIWMTQWTSRNSDAASQETRSSNISTNEELRYAAATTMNNSLPNGGQRIASRSVKRIETKTVEVVDEIIKTSSENLQTYRPVFERDKIVNCKNGVRFPFGEGTSRKRPPVPKWTEAHPGGKDDGVFVVPKDKVPGRSSYNVSYKVDVENYAVDKGKNVAYAAVGSYSATLAKTFNTNSNLPPRIAVDPSREIVPQRPIIELPDINLEPPPLPSPERDKLPAPVEQQPKPRPREFPSDNRWVKRLRPNSSNSHNSDISSSQEKTTKLFGSIIKSGGETSSKPPPRPTMIRKELGREGHAWIKRWLRNGSRMSILQREAVYEPIIAKVGPDKEKRLPSVAAMAMMGKLLACPQPLELQRRGACLVWKTNGI